METVVQPVDNPEQGTTQQPAFAVVETGENSMYVSLSRAAKVWGKHKGTISKHVKEGKLQWHDHPGGTRKLFAPEIAHLYGPPPSNGAQPVDNPKQGTTGQPQGSPGNANEITALQAVVNAKDEVIKVLQSQLEREREVAEQWRKEYGSIKEQMLALPAPKNTPEEPPKKGFWPFRRKS
jgi:hypothetical protein